MAPRSRDDHGLGFNSIKTWVDWASTEPKRGELHFEALDQLLTLSDETGLRVIVQFYTDSAPAWVGAAFPDAEFVTDQGVRAAMTDFIAKTSARARRHASLYGFDVWSEPHIVNWVWFKTPAAFCYCPYTLARFRASATR